MSKNIKKDNPIDAPRPRKRLTTRQGRKARSLVYLPYSIQITVKHQEGMSGEKIVLFNKNKRDSSIKGCIAHYIFKDNDTFLYEENNVRLGLNALLKYTDENEEDIQFRSFDEKRILLPKPNDKIDATYSICYPDQPTGDSLPPSGNIVTIYNFISTLDENNDVKNPTIEFLEIIHNNIPSRIYTNLKYEESFVYNPGTLDGLDGLYFGVLSKEHTEVVQNKLIELLLFETLENPNPQEDFFALKLSNELEYTIENGVKLYKITLEVSKNANENYHFKVSQ
ncbi:MAG: hypothetical protein AB8G11_17960 [Saprospiraceae bacterium]